MIFWILIVLAVIGVALIISYTRNDMAGEGKLLLDVVFVFVGVIGSLIIKASEAEARECAQILAMSKTNSDSIKVLLECGKNDDTVVMPMPIYIGR